MPSIYNWSKTASSNANADSEINWAEGQDPGTVNDSARVMMKRTKDFIGDIGGDTTVGGTANAITVTAGSAFTDHENGLIVALVASSSNTAAATLNVNSVGAKSIRKMTPAGEAALSAGDIVQGGIYSFVYNTALNSASGGWLLVNPTIAGVETGVLMDFAGSTAPSGYLMCYGQAISRTTYAALFSVISTTYGVGDGSTTFNLPDLRGRVSAGKDNMGGSTAGRITSAGSGIVGTTLGAAGGIQEYALYEAQLPALTKSLSITDPGHAHTIPSGFVSSIGTSTTPAQSGSDLTFNNNGGTTAASVTNISGSVSFGGGAAHNNTQPTIILNKIIKI